MESENKLQNLSIYEKMIRKKAIKRDDVVNRLKRDYEKFMSEADAGIYEDLLFKNRMRPAYGAGIGALVYLLSFKTRINSFKEGPRKISQLLLGISPVLYAIKTTPTQQYIDINEHLYIKYYKQVTEQLIKESNRTF